MKLSEMRVLNDFMLCCNPPTEDEDSVITKLSSKAVWKGYLEFHKYVVHVENTCRGYLQLADVIPQACIDVVVEVLQVSVFSPH